MSPSRTSLNKTSISRRDFLKLGGMTLGLTFGLFLPGWNKTTSFEKPWSIFSGLDAKEAVAVLNNNQGLDPGQQGRVLEESIDVFDIPSFKGNKLDTFWRDRIIPITEATLGNEEESHNPVWYKIGDEGYAHSGSIQPVRTILNTPADEIPEGGILAEVTVPFTDARWSPGKDQLVAYRFYYETTYWVVKIVHDSSGVPWYSVLDDKWEFIFYVPAAHLRLIPVEELNPLSPEIHPALKRIEVHLPEQIVIAYEMDEPVFMARTATGAKFSNGDYSTPTGRRITFHKRASRHMAAGNLAANSYDLPGVPWNSYITEEGIAFHGTYWHNNYGRPRSHGCINLSPRAAKWIYLWTLPTVPPDQPGAYENYGTAVDIIG
jgi:hypothetical protein